MAGILGWVGLGGMNPGRPGSGKGYAPAGAWQETAPPRPGREEAYSPPRSALEGLGENALSETRCRRAAPLAGREDEEAFSVDHGLHPWLIAARRLRRRTLGWSRLRSSTGFAYTWLLLTMSSKAIYEWVKKIHMYSGLLTFTAFVIWGVTGVNGVFLPKPGEFTPPPVSSVREVPFQADDSLDDRELAKAIFDTIQVPLAGGHYNIHRDEDLNLAFNVFTINGGRQVTFLEDQGIVRVEHRANSFLSYLSSVHTAHSHRHQLTLASSAWGYYNEFSTWAFLFMTASGVYMWLATRPGMRWAQLSFLGMAALTAALWIAIR